MPDKATVFEFTSYAWEPEKKRAVFHYATKFTDGAVIPWTESIILPEAPIGEIPTKLLEGLHIMLGISYWKFYCATNIELPYILSKQEADFFTTVYKKGLGEFFYQNKLDPKISPKFSYAKATTPQTQLPPKETRATSREVTFGRTGFASSGRSLVGIGGGKDSIVSAELLKAGQFDFTSFHIETAKGAEANTYATTAAKPNELVDNVIKTIGAPSLKIQRFMDWQVYQPHQYNGHIPISAIYAFLGIFSCIAYGYDSFIVSNEHSSNFGNINYKGLEVNHQWSKSFEFETLFSDYIKNTISEDVKYFSLLRNLYEIRIVELFAGMKKYFPLFSSCNKNFTAQGNENGKLWCGVCAKCVFAFTLLSAFITKKELIEIFGKDLYKDKALLPMFKDILGLGTMKPFDCVGTFQEAQTAFIMAGQKFLKAKKYPEVFYTNPQNNIPEEFKLLSAKNVYILGYGKEGKITKEYVKKQYPKLKVKVGDLAIDKNYLKKQADFDVAIKTPGIKKELVEIPYTTATNLFFSHVKNKNLIIGVTGSKGKSTTSSLIYHILKTAGKDVELLGNIGKPMLEALLKPIPTERIFVLELSSYQLDDSAFSPDIAVVTNLFPEHMDFHGSLKNYYQAKKNIIKTAKYFVYNKKTAHWLKDFRGIAVEFSPKKYESNLLGEHNESNIGASVAVAEILKISEEKIKEAVKSFKGLAHRLEFVGEFKGVKFYDDAISTTPESTIMAIKALKNIDTIFLGGQDRGYDFTQLEKEIRHAKIKNFVLFPDSGTKILSNVKDLNIVKTKSMKDAIAFAYKNTAQGKICLLSCASPSYSLWKNFEIKGDEFKKYIKQLGK